LNVRRPPLDHGGPVVRIGRREYPGGLQPDPPVSVLILCQRSQQGFGLVGLSETCDLNRSKSVVLTIRCKVRYPPPRFARAFDTCWRDGTRYYIASSKMVASIEVGVDRWPSCPVG